MSGPGTPNCYECIHRRSLVGDAHSRCAHPEVGEHDEWDLICRSATGELNEAGEKLGILADFHGIRNGWFMWPGNFDPVWLRACKGFSQRMAQGTQGIQTEA